MKRVASLIPLATLVLVACQDVTQPQLGTSQSPSFGIATPLSGLVSWWPGDGHANDIVGQNHGTLNGAAFAAGKVKEAFSFDGVDDFVTFGNTVGNFGTSDFSIDWWMKTSLSGVLSSVIGKRAACNAVSQFDVRMLTTGKLFFALRENGVIGTGIASVSAVNDGQYHHIATVREGVTNTIYVDGVLEKTGTATGVVNVTNSAEFNAGRSACVSNGTTVHYNGELDEIEISDRALSATEIQGIFDAGKAGVQKPPVCVLHNGRTVRINAAALQAHLAHGDAQVACPS